MSLVAWYPFNGTYNNQGCGDADLTVTTSPSYAEGKIGQCLTTGGFSWTAAQTSKILNNNAISFAFWIYPTASSGSSILFGHDTQGTGNNRKFSIFTYPSPKDLHLSWQNDDGSTSFLGGVWYGVFPVNTWTHCCITYQNPTAKIYINGAYHATATGISNSSTFAYTTQVITSSSIRKINDFRVYDHCLSAKEVKEISKGLCLHYTMADPYVEATTNINSNIAQGIDNTCYNGATKQYGYGTSTDMYKTMGVFQGKQCTKVYMGTAGLTAFPFIFFSPLHPAQSSYKTLSFDYYPTIGNTVNFYTYGGSATASYRVNNGPVTSGSNIPVKINQWNHIELTLYGTSSSVSGWGYMQTVSHTSSINNYWLFANVQIEEKDHATPYTSGSRNETSVADRSGFRNNGEISNLKISSASPRNNVCTYFNGSGYIHKALMPFNSSMNEFTISFWCKLNNLSDTMAIINCRTAVGAGLAVFHISGKWRIDIGSGQTNFNYGVSAANTWYHVTFVKTSSSKLLYINGVLQQTVSGADTLTSLGAKGSIGISTNVTDGTQTGTNCLSGYLSDFRVYATALSATDIADLYKNSASIDKNGNLHCYQLVEE